MRIARDANSFGSKPGPLLPYSLGIPVPTQSGKTAFKHLDGRIQQINRLQPSLVFRTKSLPTIFIVHPLFALLITVVYITHTRAMIPTVHPSKS